MDNEEKFENADVVCGDCKGQWQTLRVENKRPRLFTKNYFQTLIHQCTLCGKTSNPFTVRIPNQPQQQK